MMIRNRNYAIGIVTALAAVVMASGCATKKFVHAQVNPLGTRVGTLEQTADRQGKDIEELERSASLAGERALTADSKAMAAAEAAGQAKSDARRADGKAVQAQTSAQQALNGVERLSARVDNLDNYEFASKETILFGLESSALTSEAKSQLDTVAQRLEMKSPFVIEVQGFTDQTGAAAYNLVLSERRAQAVVRYLTTELDVPLHRIHTIGQGSAKPAADNKTRQGREMNRRVEVRLFTADMNPLTAELQMDEW